MKNDSFENNMFRRQRIRVSIIELLMWYIGFQEMERKNATRLSAMEQNQAETDRRLEDVMKSNLHLQNMLQTVINSLKVNEVVGGQTLIHNGKPVVVEASPCGAGSDHRRDRDSGRVECNEQW